METARPGWFNKPTSERVLQWVLLPLEELWKTCALFTTRLCTAAPCADKAGYCRKMDFSAQKAPIRGIERGKDSDRKWKGWRLKDIRNISTQPGPKSGKFFPPQSVCYHRLLLLSVGMIRAILYIRDFHGSGTFFYRKGRAQAQSSAQAGKSSFCSLSPRWGMIRGWVPRQSAPNMPSNPFNIGLTPPRAASRDSGRAGDMWAPVSQQAHGRAAIR